MWLPVLGLLIGLLIGFILNLQIVNFDASYLAVSILAALDALFGGIKAQLKQSFDERIFLTGFVTNLILALSLTFLGVHLGVDLYLAVIFFFTMRMFNNVASVRRYLLQDRNMKQSDHDSH